MANGAPTSRSSTGLEENTAAGLAVVTTWIGALVFYLLEKESRFVRFYALQEMALSVGIVALGIIGIVSSIIGALIKLPLLGLGINSLTSAVYLICWVIMIVNAFQGKVWELPILGQWCRRQAGL